MALDPLNISNLEQLAIKGLIRLIPADWCIHLIATVKYLSRKLSEQLEVFNPFKLHRQLKHERKRERRLSLRVWSLWIFDAGSSTGAGEQFEEPLVTETTANKLVFRQNSVSVRIHSVEYLLRSHGRHLTVLRRFIVRHEIDRLVQQQNMHTNY